MKWQFFHIAVQRKVWDLLGLTLGLTIKHSHFLSDWNSALFIILNGTKEEHLDMLDGGIIQRLLEEKWKTFARVRLKFSYTQVLICFK